MPKGKTQRNMDLIEAARDILEAIHPASVRAVCYQLFIRKLLPSMAKTCTNRVSTQLVDARKAGIIPWSWIVDETRDIERPGTWAPLTPGTMDSISTRARPGMPYGSIEAASSRINGLYRTLTRRPARPGI